MMQTLALNGYSRKLEIYGPKGTKEWFGKYSELVGRRVLEKLDLDVREVGNGVVFDAGGYFVEAREMAHDCASLGYVFVVKEKHRLDREKLKRLKIPSSPLLGELAKGKSVKIDGKKIDGKKLLYKEAERRVAFVMDTRDCEGAREIVKDADLLVIESTYSKEESGDLLDERAHLSSVEAARIAKKGKVKALALVHLSQRYEGIPKKIREEAVEVFGEGVSVPEDLDEVIL